VPIDFGATITVAGNYITYVIGGLLIKPAISWAIEFIPYFNYDDSVEHNLYVSAGSVYYMAKLATNSLRLRVPGTSIEVLPGIYGAYWINGQRNVIVVSTITGNNNIYLNGVPILSANATAWTVSDAASLYLIGVGAPLVGKYLSFKIFTGNTAADLLTAQEAYDYYHQRTY
jgi:hypothetical protein